MAEPAYTIERLGPIIDEPPPHQANPADEGEGRPPVKFEISSYVPTPAHHIPPRDFIYPPYFIRGFTSITAATGASGKSSLLTVEALSMSTALPLLGIAPKRPFRVLICNLEDPKEEVERKLAAAIKHFKIRPDQIGNRLFIFDGRKQNLIIATQSNKGTQVNEELIAEIIRVICENLIDVVIIDPFISSHGVSENDNSAMDAVAKAFNRICDEGQCSVHLVHHLRKSNGDTPTTDSARGAKSPTDAARAVRLIVGMTAEQGEQAGVDNHRLYFQVLDGKMNLAPPNEKGRWFRLVPVDLENATGDCPSDRVAVVEPFEWPDAAADVTVSTMFEIRRRIGEGEWRDSEQSEAWAGRVVADVMGLDTTNKGDRHRIKKLLAMWKASGALKVVMKPDAQRRPRPHVVPGDFNEGFSPPPGGGAEHGGAV